MESTDIVKERADRPSSQRKIAKILTAARTEFFANGFSGASIESIAALAEVSKVTVYNWFSTKENLFAEVVKAECRHMSESLVGENSKTRSLRETLIAVAERMLDSLTKEEKVRFDRVLAAEVDRDPRIGQFFLDNGPRTILQNIVNLLKISQEKGEIQSNDLTSSAEMFVSLVMGRIDLFLRYGENIKLTAAQKRERARKAVDAWMQIHQI
ncbi:TetR/AcrR family transcriptional regulator [uncultured Parasphingorhabdus sp.]|uniref:TetR/AcrR family transcriptional regulator n=1 Tax=uncultured Parasphingorhabdus sp. TaxID=2709694 RepID=UPI002AA8A9C9|nr:TetR/AcrR family transcriptional regulator [uncultured Parasphingorhabdus sp.]